MRADQTISIIRGGLMNTLHATTEDVLRGFKFFFGDGTPSIVNQSENKLVVNFKKLPYLKTENYNRTFEVTLEPVTQGYYKYKITNITERL